MATGKVLIMPNGNNGTIQYISEGSGTIEFQISQVVSGLCVGCKVDFTPQSSGFGQPEYAINIKIIENPQLEPVDEGTIKTGNISGELNINAGQIITIKEANVDGDINMNGGKLIIKTNSIIKGSVDARNEAIVHFYNSSINGNLNFRNSSYEITIINGKVGGDMDLRNSAKIDIINGTVGGDMDLRACETVMVDTVKLSGTSTKLDIRNNRVITMIKNILVENGNIEIKNNTGCKYQNIVALNGIVDIQGCTSL